MDVELDDDHAVQPMGSLQQDQKEEEEEIEANKNEDWNDFVCRTISESGWGSGDDDLVNSITELTRRDPSNFNYTKHNDLLNLDLNNLAIRAKIDVI
eukprot:933017_1